MAVDEPYDLMPHKEIVELKKQVEELKSERYVHKEILNSMDALKSSMDAMLKLFTQASEELKLEEEGPLNGNKSSMNEKLNQIIDQNKSIAEGIVTISEIVEDFAGKQKSKLRPIPEPDLQFPPINEQELQQPPKFEPEFGDLPSPQQLNPPPRPSQKGPIAMPSIPFSSLGKPKKRGLFGRLKQ